ncbi:MAG: hypothetical protein ACYCYE_09075 [Clostridia bacterium]
MTSTADRNTAIELVDEAKTNGARESLLIMSTRHVRLLCQASTILQSPAPCSAWVVPVMPINMPREAHCQKDCGINVGTGRDKKKLKKIRQLS